jgi:hypothetical protein
MSSQPAPVKIPTLLLGVCLILAVVGMPAIAWLSCDGWLQQKALLAVLEFFTLFATYCTAIVLHDRARGTVQPAATYQVKGLLTMLLPACLVGAVGAVVGRWLGYLGDAEAPLTLWGVIGAGVAATVYLSLFWNVPVWLQRPELVGQVPVVTSWILFAALTMSLPARNGWYLAALLTLVPLVGKNGPRRPAPDWLSQFYAGVAIGTVWLLLVGAFAVFVAVFLLADTTALVRSIRAQATLTEPTIGLSVLIALALAFLVDWRFRDRTAPQLIFLRVVAFAVFLLLAVCLTNPEPGEEVETAIRQASRQGGFLFKSVVAVSAVFTLLDVVRWLHDRCGEKLP